MRFQKYLIEAWSPTFRVWGTRGHILAKSWWSAFHGARYRHRGCIVRVVAL